MSVLGLSAGALVHVAAATAGLSAILLTSSLAFEVVKTLGAAYLIYLGIRTLLARREPASRDAAPPRPTSRLFADGVIVSVLNPKIAVFFLAFLPQFVDPGRGAAAQPVLFLGLLYVAMALVTDGAYALLAGTLRQWLGRRVMHSPVPQYASGIIYIGLGVSTALTGRRQ